MTILVKHGVEGGGGSGRTGETNNGKKKYSQILIRPKQMLPSHCGGL